MKVPALVAFFGWQCVSSMAAAQAKPNVDEIVKKIQDRKVPDNSFSDVLMTIKKGESSVEKTFKTWSLRITPDETHSLIEFTKPGNTKILTHSKLKNEDDRWIKTSTGQAKRISSSAENNSFAQSHFSYSDLEFAKLTDFANELICEGARCEFDDKGTPIYKIKSTPKTNQGEYVSFISYVRVSDSFPTKTEYYAKDGKLIKELLVEESKDLSGFVVPMILTMKMSGSGDFTRLKVNTIDLNSKTIKKQMFDKSQL